MPTDSPTPAGSERLVTLANGCNDPPHQNLVVTIMADGRAVRGVTDWSERQLTPADLEKLTRDVLAAPLLQASGEYKAEQSQANPSIQMSIQGPICSYHFIIGEGTGAVVVHSDTWQGDAQEAENWVRSPERKELDRLANLLLAATGWTTAAWKPYVATSNLLWVTAYPTPVPEGIPSAVKAAWPFNGPIEGFGDSMGVHEPATWRCGYLDPSQASGMLAALAGLGIEATLAHDEANLATASGWVTIHLTPRAPDGFPTCSDEAPFHP